MKCEDMSCPGEILDGYCSVCGMPGSGQGRSVLAADAAPPPLAPHRRASSSMPAVPPRRPTPVRHDPCRQPGCRGAVIDGYCDTCGAPAGADPLTPAEQPPTPAPVNGQVSQRLGSMALGSARSGAQSRRRVPMVRAQSSGIGGGLIRVPPAPVVDPRSVLLEDPRVPEDRRNCPQCGSPVGRSRDGRPGRSDGFCPQCRTRFSFDPVLQPGDLVAGQYEVQGALAHGGMGWIHLATDRNVSDRWVVLKGLLNSADPDLVAAAIAEQRFLAQVQHPLIVEIYNFVMHEGAGYIVMEYVGGRSLKQLLKDRRAARGGEHDPLPVAQAIAYVVEVLPAFSYLHRQGLVYCDFKPDNVLQVGDAVKLIDLGGVRRMDDEESAIYGTVGYQAPEVAASGPSIMSDLYTIGRTLLVLCAEFRGYQSTYQFSLPSPEELPVLAQHDSLYRLLLRCCAPNPADRFQSAEELRQQLLGVLREVVGAESPGISQTSTSSTLFGPPRFAADSTEWEQLPSLLPDAGDPAHQWLLNINIDDPVERLSALTRAPQVSPEVLLARAQAGLEMRNRDVWDGAVTELLDADPWDWRAVWVSGVGALQERDWATAQSAFNAVYGQVPGELAPKLALAIACEHGGEPDVAETLYAVCAGTDANYVTSASFGLARIRASRGDLPGALAAVDVVPATSRGYSESRRMRAQHLVAMSGSLSDLGVAMRSVNQARLDSVTRERYVVHILEQAMVQVAAHGDQPSIRIDDVPARASLLRDRLESAYRDLAKAVVTPAERTALIDRANAIRPWSLL